MRVCLIQPGKPAVSYDIITILNHITMRRLLLIVISILITINIIISAALYVYFNTDFLTVKSKSSTARTVITDDLPDIALRATSALEEELEGWEILEADIVEIPAPSTVDCTGNWFHIASMPNAIGLGYDTLDTWNVYSGDVILSDTLNNQNIVSIGHNTCSGTHCNIPITQYSQIINVDVGEEAKLCINNTLYTGNVFFSQAVSEYDIYVADPNWKNRDIFTAYTCYGPCTRADCLRTAERWVVSFYRNRA